MVICKYFLRGTCRFGENCKNEHVCADSASSALRKKQDLDPSLVIKAISNDMEKAEKGNQWPLSTYGPFQGKPCLPGFDDKCFEEIRLEMYEAQKNGTVEQYKQQLALMLQEVRLKMQSLQNPSTEVSHLLQELYNNVPESLSSPSVYSNPSPFTSNSPLQSNSVFGAAASSSIFGGAQPTGAPNFSFALPESKSIFGNVTGSQGVSNSGSIFASPSFPPSNNSVNIFATASQSLFPSSQTAFQNPSFFNTQQNSSNSSIFNNQTTTTVVNNPFAQPFTNPQSPLVNQLSQFGAPATSQSPFSTRATNPPPYGAPTAIQTPFGAPTTNPPPYTAPSTNPTPFAAPATNPTPFAAPATNPTPFAAPATNSTPFAAPATNPTPFAAPATNPTPFAAPAANPSPFGAPFSAPATNQPIFAAPVASATNPSPFGNTFAGSNPPAQENRSIFAQSSQTGSMFGRQTGSVNTQYFKSDTLKSTRQDDATVYSKLEQLIESEVKYYESPSFEFGKIPEKPPTLQMCSS